MLVQGIYLTRDGWADLNPASQHRLMWAYHCFDCALLLQSPCECSDSKACAVALCLGTFIRPSTTPAHVSE
eukprot:269860-Pleurochrysis_carterae.AAC.2